MKDFSIPPADHDVLEDALLCVATLALIVLLLLFCVAGGDFGS